MEGAQNLKYFSKSFSVVGQMVLFLMQVWWATTALGYTTKTYGLSGQAYFISYGTIAHCALLLWVYLDVGLLGLREHTLDIEQVHVG